MKPKRPLSRKIFLIVLIPLLFEVSFLSAILFLFSKAEQEYAAEAHALELIGRLNLGMTDMIGVGMFTYIYLLTGSERPLHRAERSAVLMQSHIAPLKALVAKDDRLTKKKTFEFINTYEKWRQSLHATEELSAKKMSPSPLQPHASDSQGAFSAIQAAREDSQLVAKLAEDIIATQLKVSSLRGAKYEEFRRIVDMMLKAGVGISLVIFAGISVYFNQYVRRRIETLISNTVLYASNLPLPAAMDGDDEISMLDMVFRESSQALAEAGRRQRVVVENAANLIFSLDATGRILSINESVEKLLGYRPEDCLGVRFSKFVFGENSEAFGTQLSDTVKCGEGSFESKLRKLDGSFVFVNLVFRWSQTDRTLSGVVHDISERKKSERLKREFSEVMRRGLHGPLDSMQALFNKLGASSDVLTPNAVAKAAVCQKEIARLLTLLDEFVKIDTVAANDEVVGLSAAKAQELIEHAAGSLKDWAAQRNVEIVFEKSTAEVLADPEQIVRVLVNLLSNAIKFSPRGAEVKVLISDHSNELEFQVIDKGPGISSENQTLVFEKFKQLEQAAETKNAGTGLGLAICQSIVASHHGSIGVVSDGVNGSCFWFRLPKPPEPVEAESPTL